MTQFSEVQRKWVDAFLGNGSSPALADNASEELVAGQLFGSADAIASGTGSVGLDTGGVLASPSGAAPAKSPAKVKTIRFRLKVTKDMLGMKSEEIWEVIVAQYRNISRDQAKKLIGSKQAYQLKPQPAVTKEELDKGYRDVKLVVPSEESVPEDEVAKMERAMDDFARLFHQLSKEDQRMIEAHMNKLGHPLRKGIAKDETMIPEWLKAGLELVQQRLAIAALDPEMFRFIMRHANTRLPLSPELYGKVLEVAAEFEKLKRYDAAWKDFANQATVQPKDFEDFSAPSAELRDPSK